MASHVCVDFTKQGGIRSVNFNEADLITCFANDYGYEHWVAKAIEFYGNKGDLAILISSSGNSKNMINGAQTANNLGIDVATFTGFNIDNSLKKEGKINLDLFEKLLAEYSEREIKIAAVTSCSNVTGVFTPYYKN